MRGGEPASTMPMASPSRASATRSLAALLALSQRVPFADLASMLIESSRTIDIAIEAPP